MKSKSRKPPKLRGEAGAFYKKKDYSQIYCLIMAYRLKKEPHIWLYKLEERTSIGDPSTVLSKLCETGTGKNLNTNYGVLWEPVYDYFDACEKTRDMDRYAFGDSIVVTAKSLKNDYVKISSGEILD